MQNKIIEINITVGEYYDRLSILHLKTQKIKDINKINLVREEYNYLLSKQVSIDENLYNSLITVNELIWNEEEKIRFLDRKCQWDSEFIECSRSIHKLNDQRNVIKNTISNKFGSNPEVKSHGDIQ